MSSKPSGMRMTQVAKHYETLLADYYSWMFGVPFAEKVSEQADLLRKLGLHGGSLAIDLGSGSGFQSIALAQIGYARVHALDTSAALLSELEERAVELQIKTHNEDLLNFRERVEEKADAIICMGDTLTHLARYSDVKRLFAEAEHGLSASGKFVLSWRDLTDVAQGLDRFIPLRATDDAIMTCFIEDVGDVVLVHDLIHKRTTDGWSFHRSAYPKLKLSTEWVLEALSEAGLEGNASTHGRGMEVVIAHRR